jgi:hypothetical protein
VEEIPMNEFMPVSFKRLPKVRSLKPSDLFNKLNIIDYVNYAVTPNEKIPCGAFIYQPENSFISNYTERSHFTYLVALRTNLFIENDMLLVMTKQEKLLLGRAHLTKPNELFIGNEDYTKGCLMTMENLHYIGRIISIVTEFK